MSRATRYPPEKEEGKVEYKYKLVIEKAQKIERLISQMKYRLAEGGGEAFYILGVADNGEP
ncbi:MAG: elongation factor 1-alpha, partial [Thermoprotei archaeon]